MYRFALAVGFALIAGPALAQGGVDLNPVIRDVVAPLAITLVSGVASAVLTWGFSWFRAKTGLEIESKNREALHSAILSGINYGISTVVKSGQVPRISAGGPIQNAALSYVLRSVPDAVKSFNLTEDRIRDMIMAKMPQVLGTTEPVPPPSSS